jgi:hypothetical protein
VFCPTHLLQELEVLLKQPAFDLQDPHFFNQGCALSAARERLAVKPRQGVKPWRRK